MAQSSNTGIIGLIAIVVGGMLVMGGLMFLLVTLLMSDLPRVILIPPLVQIALGMVGSTAGFFLRRGSATAKFVLVFVTIGVVINLAFLMSIGFATIR